MIVDVRASRARFWARAKGLSTSLTKEQLLILKADILLDLQAISEIYTALDQRKPLLDAEDERIVVAYYLHNLYSAFESIFQRIAEIFGNHISDRAGWHTDLFCGVPGCNDAFGAIT